MVLTIMTTMTTRQTHNMTTMMVMVRTMVKYGGRNGAVYVCPENVCGQHVVATAQGTTQPDTAWLTHFFVIMVWGHVLYNASNHMTKHKQSAPIRVQYVILGTDWFGHMLLAR